MSFPRPLTLTELEFIHWLLPDSSVIYSDARKQIISGIVLGEGRWGEGDLMVGTNNAEIDRTLSMMPIIAFGECQTNLGTLSISVHEPNLDEMIEVQFSGIFPIPENIEVITGWTYSYWEPGQPAPSNGDAIREVVISDSKDIPHYTIALSPSNKTLWCFNHSNHFTQLLAVTGFMDELLRTHGIRDAALVTNPAKAFDYLNEYSDTDIRKAFIEYAKVSSRKFELDGLVIESPKAPTSLISKLFQK